MASALAASAAVGSFSCATTLKRIHARSGTLPTDAWAATDMVLAGSSARPARDPGRARLARMTADATSVLEEAVRAISSKLLLQRSGTPSAVAPGPTPPYARVAG